MIAFAEPPTAATSCIVLFSSLRDIRWIRYIPYFFDERFCPSHRVFFCLAHAPDAIATTTEDDVITCLSSTFTDDANHFTQLSHVAALSRSYLPQLATMAHSNSSSLLDPYLTTTATATATL